MKKFLLAILLLVMVIGVSYVKDWRQSQHEESLFSEGVKAGEGSADSLRVAAESLEVLIDQQQELYADSAEITRAEYASRIDSLEGLIAQRDSSLKSSSTAPDKPAATKPSAEEERARRQQEKNDAIIAYYKKRYKDLPDDLSAYEKRVALAEIAEETAAKFSITEDALKKLRRKYNLSY